MSAQAASVAAPEANRQSLIGELRHDWTVPEARALFESILPILAFANQHIEVSIRFFKALRHAAGLFETDACRPGVAPLDAIQTEECRRLVARALEIERSL